MALIGVMTVGPTLGCATDQGLPGDLLVTDLGLPSDINVRHMADAARRTHPDLQVLFMTGYASNAAISDDRPGRDIHVMTKPFAMDVDISYMDVGISYQAVISDDD